MTTLCNNEVLELSIIPTSSSKVPFAGLKQNQHQRNAVANWQNHYLNHGYVGIITGNLEAIDIDTKNDPTGTIAKEYITAISEKSPTLINTLLTQKTVNNGLHFIYQCPETTIEGSQKLALHSNGEVLIETRGEGGYVCTHLTDYKIIQGGTLNLSELVVDIPVITPDERTFLFETARSLTRYFPTGSSKPFRYTNEAINHFNESYDIFPFLEEHGLTVVNEDTEKYYLLRQGSEAAHSGYYFKDTRTLFCFSTSIALEAGKPYNHFQLVQLLLAGGDYNTALRKLAAYGYESDTGATSDKITADDIAAYINEAGVVYDDFFKT